MKYHQIENIVLLANLGFTAHQIDRLKKISTRLHSLDEKACNYGLSESEEKRVLKLVEKAVEIVKENKRIVLPVSVRHQGDPRSCSLYLDVQDGIRINEYPVLNNKG